MPVATVERLPEQIGRYRVLRRIGRGGMGSVYEGEQANPRRRVALKVINPGVDVTAFQRRFEDEVEILARLNHPGIAHIIEAGQFDDGQGLQPFFAMEFAEGAPITDYARAHALDVAGKASLMAGICDAVHHAHQRGVIHRDLKPANILVDDGGHAKILDFGIARMARSEGSTTMHTVAGQIVGTIAYMSPEQAAGDVDAIDTRSDVHALGLMLYELLAGRLPYDMTGKSVHVAARIILEHEPLLLSTIVPSIDRDLETIVSKALEKERERRYPSAAEFASDLRRYLDHEPIVARPATTFYALAKFTRRNPVLMVSLGG